MSPQAYLARIGYTGHPVPNLATLRALHLAHLRAVPFENLDIHAGRDIVLGEEALYAKLVERRRGGICYELNALFAWLLRSIGFDVTLLAANVHVGATSLTPDFDHLVLAVDIDGARYLADVGFGDAFLLPLALGQGGWQNDGAADFTVTFADGYYTLLRADPSNPAGPARPLYRFTPSAHELADFTDRCDFHQYSMDTHFRRATVCTRATATGRVTLRGDELTVVTGNRHTLVQAATPAETAALLRQHFGIVQEAC